MSRPPWLNTHRSYCPVTAARRELLAKFHDEPGGAGLVIALAEYDEGGDLEIARCLCPTVRGSAAKEES